MGNGTLIASSEGKMVFVIHGSQTIREIGSGSYENLTSYS